MLDPEHRHHILPPLEQLLLKDRIKISINNFLSYRVFCQDDTKKTRESLEYIQYDKSKTYHGRGTVKSVETICYEILFEIVCINPTINANHFLVYASARQLAVA
ncbi:MAG: hypothetical protein ACTS73_08225 [Arsenophonus sp. NEOnobi-MAG3]